MGARRILRCMRCPPLFPILTAIAVAIPCPTVAAPPITGVEILTVDDYGTEQLPRRPREGWLALCRDRDGTTTLRRATISTRPVDSPVAPTVHVSARPCRDAPLLVRAKQGLDADRTLPTATITRSGTRAADRVVRLRLGDDALTLRLVGPTDGSTPQRWQLTTADGRTQRAPACVDCGDWAAERWDVLWAGDLDGDGLIDFVTRADGSGTQVALFLSSGNPRRLVPVATTFFGGC